MDILRSGIVFLVIGISSNHAWFFSSSPQSVDCGATGVFTLAPPYDGSWWDLPECPDEITPTFTLYTRANRKEGKIIGYSPWSIPSEFRGSRRTLFLTHGFAASTDLPWVGDLVDKLLTAEDLNVITIDWREGAKITSYFYSYAQPASNTRTVGAQTALVMERLVKASGAPWSSLWCVGHSLGAHVCGLAGMEARRRGGVLGRVTGLDPAGVYFEPVKDLTVGINPASASFVDVIHTSMSLGTKRLLGHMDFFPSDGRGQDGCSFFDDLCSHTRSHQYFSESVVSDCFAARENCTNPFDIPSSCRDRGTVLARMGFRAESSGRNGIYRLDINSKSPYCRR